MAAAQGGEASTAGPPARRGPGVFVWFLVLLLLAELLAGWRLPYRHLPRAAEVPRNLRTQRGFPEYVSGPVRGARPLAIVIGNSQAVGIEVSDPEDIWFAGLRRRLGAGPAPVDVENWSHGGLRTAELELLALTALERRPDLLVFVLHFRNFDRMDQAHLSSVSSDVPLLAGDPALWPRLPGTLVARDLDLDQRLLQGVLLHSSFARMRNPILDRLSHRVPSAWHRSVFGHRRDPGDIFGEGRTHSTEGYPTLERRARWVALGGLDEALEEIARLTDDELVARLASLGAVSTSIERLAAESGTRVLWIWGPVDAAVVPADIARRPDEFHAAARLLIEEVGGTVVDLREAVPRQQFVSLTHFGVEGHGRMAEVMEGVVRDALP